MQITSLDTAGELELNGVDVGAGQIISKADIDAGKLTFRGGERRERTPHSFQVQDDGGTANGGVDSRPDAKHDHDQCHAGQRSAGAGAKRSRRRIGEHQGPVRNANAYSTSNGSENWVREWTEQGDGNSATGGDIQITAEGGDIVCAFSDGDDVDIEFLDIDTDAISRVWTCPTEPRRP